MRCIRPRYRVGLALILVSSLAACGSKHGNDDDDDTDGTLTIEPAAATVALARSDAGYSAMQQFTVSLVKPNGDKSDVTQRVTWSSSDPHVITTRGTTTITAAGPYTVTADLGGVTVDAALTGTLTDTVTGGGIAPGDTTKLDGNPDAGQAISIAYPLAGSLFPVNVAPIEIHVAKSDVSQTLARVELSSGDLLSYKLYTRCAATPPNPTAFPKGCAITVDNELARQLAGVSEASDVKLTVRLAAADGTKLGEAQPIELAWSRVELTGGLYYWTTAGGTDTTFNTAIARYNFNGDASAPTIYLSSAAAPKVPNGQTQCIGCHAISPDGAKLSFALGGSTPGFFSLFDVATTAPTQSKFDNFAGMSTFSPDGSRMVTMSYGKLTLRTADATLGAVSDGLFATTIQEKMSHPFWSPTGGHFAFVSWTPSAADVTAGHNTGDMVQGGQLWIADSDGVQVGASAPRLLVPRADNITSYYPAISDDDRYVVFNRSRCDGPPNSNTGWGVGPCDGYNDVSATLQLVSVDGGAPIPLTRANGGDDPKTTNSWPRWSPDHGTFRGKRLYWVAFSSRRGYGLALPGVTNDTGKPQLWFAAVAVDASGAAPTSDPSFAPFWLPGQDPSFTSPRGNHTPAWTSKVVIFQ